MNKLLRRGHEEDEIERIVNALTEQRLQSERRFTEQYVLSRMEKGYGPRCITQELRVKGIDLFLFEEVTRAENIDWLNVLGKAYRRRYRDMLPKSPAELQKRRRFLHQQRGFTLEQVDAFLKSISN